MLPTTVDKVSDASFDSLCPAESKLIFYRPIGFLMFFIVILSSIILVGVTWKDGVIARAFFRPESAPSPAAAGGQATM